MDEIKKEALSLVFLILIINFILPLMAFIAFNENMFVLSYTFILFLVILDGIFLMTFSVYRKYKKQFSEEDS